MSCKQISDHLGHVVDGGESPRVPFRELLMTDRACCLIVYPPPSTTGFDTTDIENKTSISKVILSSNLKMIVSQ